MASLKGTSVSGQITVNTNNLWLTPSKLVLGRTNDSVYAYSVIGVTDGNLHLDSYDGKGLYLNYYQTTKSNSKVYFNGDAYYIQNGYFNGKSNYSNRSYYLEGTDTRNTNTAPNGYQKSNYGMLIQGEFKNANSIGYSGSSWYGYMMTITPWPDSSGSRPFQIFGSSDKSTIGIRYASNDTTWGDWSAFITEASIGSQSVNYAASAGSAGSADTSSYTNYMNITDSRLGKGSNKLQFMQYAGAGDNPTNDWYSHIICHHGNSAGYYQELALPFHHNRIYYRNQQAGSTKSWVGIALIGDNVSNFTNDSGYITSGQDYNLIAHNNEFTFVPSGYNQGSIYLNYRTQGGTGTHANISEYILGNGNGQSLGRIVHTGNFSYSSGTLTINL